MSQPGAASYSSHTLPHIDELSHVPLTAEQLMNLYALTDWRVVLLGKRVKRNYQQYYTVSMFKALALPYLINLSSERAVARALAERESLRTLCGFKLEKPTPTRSSFWHFRAKYPVAFPELMLRVLISLVLSGSEPNLSLPFVTPISPTAEVPDGRFSDFRLDSYRPLIEVWTTPIKTNSGLRYSVVGKTWLELAQECKTRGKARSNERKGLETRLGLPTEVRTQLQDGRHVRFGIDKPDWMGVPTRAADTLTRVGPATFRPYTACNVLVIREHRGKRSVLLGRRLAGYGTGTYMLPGGKQRPNESLEECAARELLEETGIVILKSRPVSLRRTRLPGKPPVLSIGVLAEDNVGEPEHREPTQNSAWQWFDLDSLPAPLFEPTRIAITHYLDNTYPGLRWTDVESQMPPHYQEPTRQLDLLSEL